MNRRIIYSRSDGGVSVLIPCRCIDDDHLTDDEIFQRSWDRLQRDMDPLPHYKEVLRPIDPELDEAQLSLVTQLYCAKGGISLVPLDAIYPQVVTIADIPQDRYFRNAWDHGGDRVTVNMDKAREIHLNRIRDARDKKLIDLDKETMKALGKKDDVFRAAVEAQKQVLRDIPQTIDLTVAKTPEELKALWPKEL